MMDRDELLIKLKDARTLINDGYNQRGTYISGKRCKFCVDIIDKALVLLKEQPEIVRCKDCIHKGDPFECRLDSDLEEHGGHRTEEYGDWFCADGVKKE